MSPGQLYGRCVTGSSSAVACGELARGCRRGSKGQGAGERGRGQLTSGDLLHENNLKTVLAKNIFEICHPILTKANSIHVHYSTPSYSLNPG